MSTGDNSLAVTPNKRDGSRRAHGGSEAPRSPPPLHSETLSTVSPPAEQYARVGRCQSTGRDVSICYHTFGDPADPCLVLIQGIGVSALGYAPAFIEHLTRAGYYVVRFDNRDTGLSTNFNDYGAPCLLRFALPAFLSFGERVPYTLEDMARDVLGLLDALGVRRAHVFGMSMGGMIAQLVLLLAPERVLSLSLLFTDLSGYHARRPPYTHYARFLVPPRLVTRTSRVRSVAAACAEYGGAKAAPAGGEAEAAAETRVVPWVDEEGVRRAVHQVWMLRFLSQGQHRDLTTAAARTQLAAEVALGFRRDGDQSSRGVLRHIAAVMRAPSRRNRLRRLRQAQRDAAARGGPAPTPALVMHGELDPLVPVANAWRLVDALDEAKLVLFPRLGHDFPPSLYREFALEILLNMQRAEPAGAPVA